jgi:hypothetical protein
MPNGTYLGDGLYASFDGYQICLRAPHEDGDHVVYLEPGTLNELHRFACGCFRVNAEPAGDRS